MISPSAFLYRYTPAEVGMVRILAWSSLLGIIRALVACGTQVAHPRLRDCKTQDFGRFHFRIRELERKELSQDESHFVNFSAGAKYGGRCRLLQQELCQAADHAADQ